MTIKVFGHKSPDTDSTGSPIIWEWYLNECRGTPAEARLLGEPNTEALFVLNRWNLDEVEVVPVPGAHGAGMRIDGGIFYTTNLPGGGPGGLVTLDARDHAVLGTTDTPFPVPHNIALTPFGRKIYVTHSGSTADKVTVYTAGFSSPVPVYLGERLQRT